MSARRSVEGNYIDPDELVWEILHVYKNQEANSWAEPDLRKAKEIPSQYPIFKLRTMCQKECDRINQKNYPK